METLNESIYDHPKYYDLVFGADCAAETKFILAVAERYMRRSATRFFEPACGTGRLLFSLAKRGVQVGGLDLNPKAVAFCNARFQRNGIAAQATVADMCDFKVPKLYDVAFNTINSFRHLQTERQALAHLQCVGRALRADGLYVLGVHLTPTDATPSDGESWSARRGHLSINTHMWTNDRNRKTRIERYGIRFDIHSPTKSLRIEDELVLRSYTAPQMDRLIEHSGCWQCVETFDFRYRIDEPIEVDSTSEDVVYILKRTKG